MTDARTLTATLQTDDMAGHTVAGRERANVNCQPPPPFQSLGALLLRLVENAASKKPEAAE